MAVSLINKILTIIRLIKEPRVVKFLISQRLLGYFIEQGWFNSYRLNSPLDKNNKPLPWMTYPFIDFVKERLNKKMKVFEFGSGNSTLFFSERVKEVISIEHNMEWFEKIKNNIPENVTIQFINVNEQYYNFIKSYENCDLIIIDGEHRNNCIYNSINSLSIVGVLVLDDSERSEYKEGVEFLIKSGFRKIDFWGFSPGLFYKKATSVFYRTGNVLGI